MFSRKAFLISGRVRRGSEMHCDATGCNNTPHFCCLRRPSCEENPPHHLSEMRKKIQNPQPDG
ncbi:unnamed protein product [Ectocarpus sp. CCAP 1310/34]|nr:unnamed protein product [Ectocarpus sp. CCAP 1310/34]